MKKILTIIAAACLLATLASSCKRKPTEPPQPTPNITGTWQGSGIKSGIKFTVTAVLAQADNDTTVSGNGDITALLTKIPFTVSGGNVYPDVRLTFMNLGGVFRGFNLTSPAQNEVIYFNGTNWVPLCSSFSTGTYVGKFDAMTDNAINGVASVPSMGITNEPLRMERIK